MPILEQGNLRIDFSDAGTGDPVILIHGSASSNRQWKRLVQVLQPRFRVMAINLYGYGETSRWNENGVQTITDQADLILKLLQNISVPVRIVGHSFGGAVASKAANLLGPQVSHLVLFEPTLFHLLAQNGHQEAFEEILALRDFIKLHGQQQDWPAIAERFVDYWNGDGAWTEMPEDRRLAYKQLLRPNYHEWDGMEGSPGTIEELANSPGQAMFVHTSGARRPIRELAQLFAQKCPRWRVVQLVQGGHMAPLTHPDIVNPLISGFLGEDLETHPFASSFQEVSTC